MSNNLTDSSRSHTSTNVSQTPLTNNEFYQSPMMLRVVRRSSPEIFLVLLQKLGQFSPHFLRVVHPWNLHNTFVYRRRYNLTLRLCQHQTTSTTKKCGFVRRDGHYCETEVYCGWRTKHNWTKTAHCTHG